MRGFPAKWSISVLMVPLVFSMLFNVCLFRAYVVFTKPQVNETCGEVSGRYSHLNQTSLLDRFAEALQFKTVTTSERNYDKEELVRFREFVTKAFPTLHSSPLVTREIIAKFSLLYTVRGSNPDLRPYLLCAHLDVVPTEREKWMRDPFGGIRDEIFIHGRGTLDAKHTLFGILEAVEYLLISGFRPQRTLLMAFGHDEEGSGLEGAATIGPLLKNRYSKIEYIMDEGTTVVESMIPGIANPVAVISVTEKGYVTAKLQTPRKWEENDRSPLNSPAYFLAKSISKFHANLHPSQFGGGPEKDMLEALAPFSGFLLRIVYSNLWLFGPLVGYQLSKVPEGNAIIRTSTAVTLAGVTEDARSLYALVNHRLHPLQSVEDVIERDKQLLVHEDISITPTHVKRSHPISSYGPNVFGYNVIERTIRQMFGNIPIVPGTLFASTDTSWYLDLTSCVYRFSPLILTVDDLKTIHSHNEKLSIENYLRIIHFYHHLILNSDELTPKRSLRDEL